MRAAVRLIVVAVLVSLPAHAQQPGFDPPRAAAVTAARIEVIAAQLQRANDLTPDAMQRLAGELVARVDELAYLSATIPSLADSIPGLRVTAEQISFSASVGTSSDVASGADDLAVRARDIRVMAENLAALSG